MLKTGSRLWLRLVRMRRERETEQLEPLKTPLRAIASSKTTNAPSTIHGEE